MKVFWSWQSDLPGKISRHFIRDALDQAITELNADLAVEEPNRDGTITLDHDRKDTPGSPTLAELIFRKISACDVFVADVTSVGSSANEPSKKLINSNVAIEFGYALGTLTERKILMVLNTAFGGRENLPFDLRHKAGPLMYTLATDADKTAIATAKKSFVPVLKEALRSYAQAPKSAPVAFEPTPSIVNDPSRYFAPDQPLVDQPASVWQRSRTLTVPTGPLLYLRLMPSRQLKQLSFIEAKDQADAGQLRPFTHDWKSSSVTTNRFGALAYSAVEEDQKILFATQVLRSGEVWGIDAYITDPTNKPDKSAPPGLWARETENAFKTCLPMYANFLEKQLNCPPPYIFEAGLSHACSRCWYVPSQFGADAWGPFLEDHVQVTGKIASTDPSDLNAALLKIFEGFFEALGRRRPRGFGGFPAESC